MLNEIELNKLEEKLGREEYISIERLNFPKNNDKAWESAISLFFSLGFLGFILFLLLLIFGGDSDSNFCCVITVFIGTPIISLISAIISFRKNYSSENFIKKSKKIKRQIEEHNKNIYEKLLTTELFNNGINKLTKEIKILESSCKEETLGVNDEDKFMIYYKFNLNPLTAKPLAEIQKAKYNDVIKYELIDKSTSTQTATSITNSNFAKAIGGAIVSDLLIGDATTGAIIGGSGARKTETTFKTSTQNLYEIVIYLNSLENSTITINTQYRNKVNDIVSILEYILRNQDNK